MPAPPATEKTTFDSAEGNATTMLYRAAVGDVNTNYYLPIFSRLETLDRPSLGWNWAAALFTLNWMAYRQLWSAALVYAGAVVGFALLVFGIGRLIFQLPQGAELTLILGFVLAAFAIPGVFGNAVFHAYCRKKMALALAANSTLAEACAMLQRKASSRRRMLWLGLLNAALLGACVSGYFAFNKAGLVPATTEKPAVVGNLAVGRTSDAAPSPAVATSAPATAPAVAAWAPLPVSVPATAPPATASAAAEVVVEEVKAKPTSSPASSPTNKPGSKAAEKSKAKPLAKQAAKTVVKPTVFYVNVGLFADDNNALNAYVKLSDAGLAALKQELSTKNGKRTRVRVGPFESEPEADKAVLKIRALGLDALIARQPP